MSDVRIGGEAIDIVMLGGEVVWQRPGTGGKHIYIDKRHVYLESDTDWQISIDDPTDEELLRRIEAEEIAAGGQTDNN